MTFATEGAYLDEPRLFSHCANLAMGDAVLRARNLDAEVEQLAIWDGRLAVNEAGTAVDVATWRRTGRPATVLDSRSDLPEEPNGRVRPSRTDRREVRAMLFADVSGYSRLTDAQIPAFVDHVLRPLGTTMERFADDLRYVNTWGDAIFAVLDSVTVAAECALALAGHDARARPATRPDCPRRSRYASAGTLGRRSHAPTRFAATRTSTATR